MSSRNRLPLGDLRGILLLVVGLSFLLSGCGSRERLDFSLTIIVADRLGESETDSFPEDVVALSLPVEECDLGFLVPNPIIYRLGYDSSTAVSLNTEIVAGFAGNPNNPRLIRREIMKNLGNASIGKVLSEPGHSTANLSSDLDHYLDRLGDRSAKLFYSSTGAEEETLEGDRIHNSIRSVQAEIGEKMCGENFSSAFVFIDPPWESHETEIALEMDRRLQDLAAQNVRANALTDDQGRQEVLEGVAEELREHEGDYRFTYELMKNRVYGRDHPEGFDLLRRAAREAIAAGEAEYLLDRINGEKDTPIEPVWRLAHGHDHEWNPILEALEHEDDAELEAEAEHHED